jgi:hypothetical protein
MSATIAPPVQPDESRPSWMGGPANTAPPRKGSLDVKSGHSALYKGAYDSKGAFAKDVKR